MTRVGASLVGARPEIVAAVDALRTIAAQRGIEFDIAEYGGLRTQADTTRILQYRAADYAVAVQKGEIPKGYDINKFRPIAQWGKSMHNYGAAFDVIVTKKPANMTGLQALNYLKDQAPKLGLVDGRDFGDGPHFELPGGLDAAKAAWYKMTGTRFFDQAVTAVNDAVDAVAADPKPTLAFLLFVLLVLLVIRRKGK